MRLNVVGMAKVAKPPVAGEPPCLNDTAYRQLVENAGDLMVEVDPQWRFLYVSPRYCELFGKPSAELLGNTFMPLVHEDDRATTAQAMQLLYHPPHTAYIEQRAMTKVGWRWLAWSDSAVLDARGHVSAIIGLGRDITDIKRTEFALREKEARYRELVENMSDGVAVFEVLGDGEDFVFKEFNRAAEGITALSRHEVIGESLIDVFPRVSEFGLLDVLRRVRRDGRSEHRPVARYQDHRIVIWVKTHVFLLNSGELVVVFEDVTARRDAEDAYDISSERYRSILETARDGFWVVDLNARLLEVNDAYCQMSGYTRDELLAMGIPDLEALETPSSTEKHIDAIMHQGNALFESQHRHKNGEIFPVEVSVSYSEIEGGHFFVFVRDIHQRKFAEKLARLREQLAEMVYQGDLEQLMRMAVDSTEALTTSQIGFFHFLEQDQQTLSLQVWSTRTLREMCFTEGKGLHYPVSEAGVWVDCIHQRRPVVHNDYAALPHKRGLPEGHAVLLRELTVPVFRGQLIVAVIGVGNKVCDYTPRDIEVVQTVADMAFDLIERKRAEQRIEYMAYYDVLTGLPNRELLSDRLTQAMAQHRRSKRLLAVCYMDLDGFKPVNDRYGHDVGDGLLVALAQRLKSMLREGDTLARLSGDEFVFLHTDLPSVEESELIVRRVLGSVSSPFEVNGYTISVSASIGITLYPADEANADTLLRHADQAMYQAKSIGQSGYHLYDPLQEKTRRAHREMLGLVSRALLRAEFILHYQPRVELNSGRVVGSEALLRWQHPQRGLLMPGEFLPCIEGEPEEIALGEWVVKRALAQLSEWRRRDLLLPVSINISPKHIQQQNFAEFLAGALAAYPQDTANYLELEILETSAIGDIAQVVEVMNACTRLGVRFSLDDFGTGYSSLAYFHRLPIDVLKIDQNFVRGMLDDVDDLYIVEGVLRLADALKRPVVAEGVESDELGLLLLHFGCRYAQGYGIAKPMPAEQLPGWTAQWQRDNVWQGAAYKKLVAGEHIELQVALFSHRRWLDKVIGYLHVDTASTLSELALPENLFVRWYEGIGRARYAQHPVFAFLLAKYTRLRGCADALLALAANGQGEAARARLAELNGFADELVAMLQKLAAD